MARQRFIHPEIWTDPSLAKLTPAERLMFIGCFSNADDEGRLLGNAAFLRSTIFPYDDISVEEVARMRDRIVAACKNLVYYTVDGIEYLAFLKWKQYQKPKYPKPSKLPPPPEKSQTKDSGTISPILEKDFSNGSPKQENDFLPGLGRDGLGMGRDGRGTGRVEAQSAPQPPSPPANQPLPDATDTERAILHELKAVQGYPFDYERDLEFVRNLAVDFPAVDLLAEAKKWRTYKLDKPLAAKSNPRSQFRNWVAKAAEWQRETRAPPSTSTASSRYAQLFREKAAQLERGAVNA